MTFSATEGLVGSLSYYTDPSLQQQQQQPTYTWRIPQQGQSGPSLFEQIRSQIRPEHSPTQSSSSYRVRIIQDADGGVSITQSSAGVPPQAAFAASSNGSVPTVINTKNPSVYVQLGAQAAVDPGASNQTVPQVVLPPIRNMDTPENRTPGVTPPAYVVLYPNADPNNPGAQPAKSGGPPVIAVVSGDPQNRDLPSMSPGVPSPLPINEGEQKEATPAPNPLPWKQLIVVLMCFFAECMSANLLYPFIADMVRDFRIARDDTSIGYFAGLLASAFILAQFFSSYPLGWLSDRVGRRPILLAGLLGNALFMALFGLSKSYGLALTWRIINGLINGNFNVVRVYIKEITDETNAHLAFSYMGLTWGVSSVAAPLLGGLLARPPASWHLEKAFYDYPYFLPCLAAACFSTLGLILGYFYLRETCDPYEGHRAVQAQREERWRGRQPDGQDQITQSAPPTFAQRNRIRPSAALVSSESFSFARQRGDNDVEFELPLAEDRSASSINSGQESKPATDLQEHLLGERIVSPTICQLLQVKNVLLLSAIFSCLRFSATLVSEAFAVWAPTAYEDGGLQFSNAEVSYCFLAQGVASIIFQMFIFAPLLKRASVTAVLSFSFVLYGITVLTTSLLRHLITLDANGHVKHGVGFWMLLILMFSLRGGAIALTFTCTSILINEFIRIHIGAAQGLISGFAALAQGVGPLIGGATLAATIGSSLPFPIDYNLTFVYTSLILFIAAYLVHRVQ